MMSMAIRESDVLFSLKMDYSQNNSRLIAHILQIIPNSYLSVQLYTIDSAYVEFYIIDIKRFYGL
jgi:hypothetical protein